MFKQNRLVLSVMGFMLVTLAACVQPAQPEESVIVPQAVTVRGATSEYLAANPELMAVERYAGVVSNTAASESTFYATNPELIAANRYSATVAGEEQMDDSAYFAANPELTVVDRYNQAEVTTDSDYFAQNPELMAVANHK